MFTAPTIRDRLPVLEIDARARLAAIDGRQLTLTPLEFDLLVHLVDHPDTVHSRSALLSQVWGWAHPDGSRTIDTHIARIRRKLGPAGSAIRTVHRIGYVVDSSRLQRRAWAA